MVKKMLFLIMIVLLVIISGCDFGEEVSDDVVIGSEDKEGDLTKESTAASEDSAPAAALCGNALCESGENKCTCPADCGACSGNYNDTYEFVCKEDSCTYAEIAPVCGDTICLPSEQGSCPLDCPTCDDSDKCTRDYFDPATKSCKHDKFTPCCGNLVCEVGEEGSCIEDCESLFDLSDYPEPFVVENQLNANIIVGEEAGPKGVIAAINVIRGLDFSGSKEGYTTESMLDSEVTSIDGKNVILIGNPCHNTFVAQLYGKTKDNCGEDLNSGDKKVRLFKTGSLTYALVVTGYNEDDVREASTYVEKWSETKMSGTEFTIK